MSSYVIRNMQHIRRALYQGIIEHAPWPLPSLIWLVTLSWSPWWLTLQPYLVTKTSWPCSATSRGLSVLVRTGLRADESVRHIAQNDSCKYSRNFGLLEHILSLAHHSYHQAYLSRRIIRLFILLIDTWRLLDSSRTIPRMRSTLQ